MTRSRWFQRLKRLLRRSPETLSALDAYALWASSYPPHAHNRLMEIEQAAMLRLMPDLRGRDVLDLACGTGRYSRIARQGGARRVVGADFSPQMLRAGRKATSPCDPLSAGGEEESVQASMMVLPFAEASFDVIICGLATGHLPPAAMRQAVAEMARALRPGGNALISDFHPYLYLGGGRRTFTAPDGTPYAVEHYPHLVSDYFDAILAAGLTLQALAEPCTVSDGKPIPAVLILHVHCIE
jgi:malonyl-CoA O-methyltransferase